MGTFRILIAGSDTVLGSVLMDNLRAPGREFVHLDPLSSKPSAWVRADVAVVDVGMFSLNQASLHRTCLQGRQRCAGLLVLLYDPPWPKAALSAFAAVKEFPKPVSMGDVARAVSQLLG